MLCLLESLTGGKSFFNNKDFLMFLSLEIHLAYKVMFAAPAE